MKKMLFREKELTNRIIYWICLKKTVRPSQYREGLTADFEIANISKILDFFNTNHYNLHTTSLQVPIMIQRAFFPKAILPLPEVLPC